ncbi:hypothetical protein PR048_004360 [Dryococelus australis]|uniref:Uncharacterized protein n=1 Tax=Dryococelus australis TaxID=614101 RepID=A0ABQ9I584_9NEOP|nr:hypothetical protein PR048_004360 [Dryococelus australis]
MDSEILNIDKRICYEYSITKTQNFTLKNRDIYTVPCNKSLRFRETINKQEVVVPVTTQIIINGIMCTINRICYKFEGDKVDSTRDVGIMATINNYVYFIHNQLSAAKMADW